MNRVHHPGNPILQGLFQITMRTSLCRFIMPFSSKGPCSRRKRTLNAFSGHGICFCPVNSKVHRTYEKLQRTYISLAYENLKREKPGFVDDDERFSLSCKPDTVRVIKIHLINHSGHSMCVFIAIQSLQLMRFDK